MVSRWLHVRQKHHNSLLERTRLIQLQDQTRVWTRRHLFCTDLSLTYRHKLQVHLSPLGGRVLPAKVRPSSSLSIFSSSSHKKSYKYLIISKFTVLEDKDDGGWEKAGSCAKMSLFHTPGDGADEVHGNATLVFGGIELVVMADLSQQLQGHQRGDLSKKRTALNWATSQQKNKQTNKHTGQTCQPAVRFHFTIQRASSRNRAALNKTRELLQKRRTGSNSTGK